jgi:hypothetical protein
MTSDAQPTFISQEAAWTICAVAVSAIVIAVALMFAGVPYLPEMMVVAASVYLWQTVRHRRAYLRWEKSQLWDPDQP